MKYKIKYDDGTIAIIESSKDLEIGRRYFEGLPFGDYENFEDCKIKNKDKKNPAAYCGKIYWQAEKEKKKEEVESHHAIEEEDIGPENTILPEESATPELLVSKDSNIIEKKKRKKRSAS